jgi:hypothetical protein
LRIEGESGLGEAVLSFGLFGIFAEGYGVRKKKGGGVKPEESEERENKGA